jgi:hypothetical protein
LNRRQTLDSKSTSVGCGLWHTEQGLVPALFFCAPRSQTACSTASDGQSIRAFLPCSARTCRPRGLLSPVEVSSASSSVRAGVRLWSRIYFLLQLSSLDLCVFFDQTQACIISSLERAGKVPMDNVGKARAPSKWGPTAVTSGGQTAPGKTINRAMDELGCIATRLQAHWLSNEGSIAAKLRPLKGIPELRGSGARFSMSEVQDSRPAQRMPAPKLSHCGNRLENSLRFDRFWGCLEACRVASLRPFTHN